MDTKIQKIGKLDHVNLFFDPLRKDDSFLVARDGITKIGFIVKGEIVLESNFNISWNIVTGIIGGFSSPETFQKIKDKINEQVK